MIFGGLQFTVGVGVVVILTEGYDGVVVIAVIIPNGCDTGILGVVVPKRCGTVVDVVVVLKGCCIETYCSLDVNECGIGGVVDDIVGVEVISGKYGGGRNIGWKGTVLFLNSF